MKHLIYLLASLLYLSLLNQCVTPLHQSIEMIQPGMDKGTVLEKIGSPHHTRRFAGKDEWTYIYYVDDQKKGKDLKFKNGSLVKIEPTRFKPTRAEQIQDSVSFKEYEKIIKTRKGSTQK